MSENSLKSLFGRMHVRARKRKADDITSTQRAAVEVIVVTVF